jgi:hypothetical protein
MDAYVHGVGLWTPGFSNAEAWCSNRGSDEALEPEAKLLHGAIRRRATRMTRLAVEALQQAGTDAGCDLSSVPTVWATAHGEHETAVAILGMLTRAEGRLSPTKFHNSVYNTASGYASIATDNRAPSTTLSGGADLVAMALLEALCFLQAGAPEVAVILVDEPILPPFDARGAQAPLSVAFCMSSDPTGARARISDLRQADVTPAAIHPRFGGLYVSAALPLLQAILANESASLPLEIACQQEAPIWVVDVQATLASDGGPGPA